MALTGTTATHVLQARVSDVDVDSKTWTIPAENNQRSGAAIQVPLAAPAMDIYTQALNELPRGDSGLLFPSRNDAQIYAARFSDVYRTLRLPIRPSMVRSAFREWLWDWGFPERLIADALGVTQSEPLFVESDTETQAERDWRTRVRMMEQWSDFLHGKRR